MLPKKIVQQASVIFQTIILEYGLTVIITQFTSVMVAKDLELFGITKNNIVGAFDKNDKSVFATT